MITVELKEDSITPVLERLKASLTDMTPVMQEIGELMVESTKRNFIEGRSPDGAPWAPKSQTTMDAYLARGDRADPRPLFGPSGRLSSEIHYEASPTGIAWGSSLIYSAVQQFGAAEGAFGSMANGSPIPWGNIPARPFLGLSDDDRSMIVATVEDWLSGTSDQ